MDHKEFRERYQYDAEKDLLGAGGFGRVYKAHDSLLDRWVALKIFSRDVPDRYDLINEIRRAIDLNHPNICRYHGAEVLKGVNPLGEAQTIQVGIMEFVEGGTIDKFLVKRPEFRQKLLADVLRGLSYLHRHHPPIIHRDLKPSNVLVSFQDGTPVARITDFGISKSISESGAQVSVMGLGTYAYMAPEQLNPVRYGVNEKVQCNLDLWSYGPMMIELLTGVLPFGAGQAGASTGQILEAITRGISSQELNSFEEPYRSVLARCMVQDAGKRAQSAEELLSLLEAVHYGPGEQRQETVVEKARVRPRTVVEDAGARPETIWETPAIRPMPEASVRLAIPEVAEDEVSAAVPVSEEQQPPRKRDLRKIAMIVTAVAVILLVLEILYLYVKLNPFSSMNPSRIEADEAAAIQSMRVIHEAEAKYQAAYPDKGYACDLAKLGGHGIFGHPTADAAQLLPNDLAAGASKGYIFVTGCMSEGYIGGRVVGYNLYANPQIVGKTGNRGFCNYWFSDDIWVDPKVNPARGADCSQRLK